MNILPNLGCVQPRPAVSFKGIDKVISELCLKIIPTVAAEAWSWEVCIEQAENVPYT